MTSIIRKMAALFLVMASLLTPSNAYGFDLCNPSWDCCETDCCDYPGPLCCGRWSALIKGGVAPVVSNDQGHIYAVRPSLTALPVINLGRTPKFDDIYDLPWTVGGELAYNLSDSAQIFVEIDYSGASGKRHNHLDDVSLIELNTKHSGFRAWSGYFGARYYFARAWLCDRVAPFVGFKAGFLNHCRTHASYTFNGIDAGSSSFHTGRSGVSAGAQIGFDVQVWDCVSAVLNFEFVAVQGQRGNNNVLFVTPTTPTGINGITNLNIGPNGTEFFFPITLGLRYEF